MPQYQDNLVYHVYNRGAHRFPVFLSADNYNYLLRLSEKYTPRYRVSRLAYCLMPNHYHFVLRQESGGSITGFLRTLFNAYVQGFNKVTGHRGTLFERSALGLLVDSDAYAMDLIRYIHLNPVSAGIVSDPTDWIFSDYGVWIMQDNMDTESHDLRNAFFGGGRQYRAFVERMEFTPGGDRGTAPYFQSAIVSGDRQTGELLRPQ